LKEKSRNWEYLVVGIGKREEFGIEIEMGWDFRTKRH
jgi:hypothetical protein